MDESWNFIELLAGIVIIVGINLLFAAIKMGYQKKKNARYYAIYQNGVLMDHLPYSEAYAYTESLHYEFRKSRGVNHKKRIINVKIDEPFEESFTLNKKVGN